MILNCMACGRPLRRQGEAKLNHPGTVVAAVSGLCAHDYDRIRKGLIKDPRPPEMRKGGSRGNLQRGRAKPKPVPPKSVEERRGVDGLVWREDLDQVEADALETVVDVLRGQPAALLEVSAALGFRNEDGLADLTTQSSNDARPLKM